MKTKKIEKTNGSFITDYINHTLTKNDVPNMNIVGEDLKKQVFSPIGLKMLGL